MLSLLPTDIKKYVLLPLLDPSSFLCLKIALTNYTVRKEDMTKETIESIVSNGIHLVKHFYLDIRKTPHHHFMPKWAIKYDQIGTLNFLIANYYSLPDNAHEIAAQYGSVSILKEIPLNEKDVISIGIQYGQEGVLEWAKKIYTFTPQEYIIAIYHNQINVLEWLKKEEYPLMELFFEVAASEGNLEILKWLKANKCPWG